MWTYNVHMKTASVRDLRNNFSTLEAWLSEGQHISIEKRGEPVAMLSPLNPKEKFGDLVQPDFKVRLQRLWGDRVFTEDEVNAMRDAELEGEEG